jgi:hypothetical protein
MRKRQYYSCDFTSIILNEKDFRTVLRALKVLAVELADDAPQDAEDVHNLRCHLLNFADDF